jgi:hypothetical protein
MAFLTYKPRQSLAVLVPYRAKRARWIIWNLTIADL